MASKKKFVLDVTLVTIIVTIVVNALKLIPYIYNLIVNSSAEADEKEALIERIRKAQESVPEWED